MKTIKMIIVVSETQHSKVYFVYIICSANFPFLTNKVHFLMNPQNMIIQRRLQELIVTVSLYS